MGNLENHARFEMRHWLASEDEMQRAIAEDVLALIRVFAKQGHSGSSAAYCRSVFAKLANYEPLGPLTGDADEWNEVGPGVFQNRRCSHVFKDESGTYDSQGRIFEEPDGSRWQNAESRVYIAFPYTPTTEIVKLASERGE